MPLFSAPLFSAASIRDLMTDEANAGRVVRKRDYLGLGMLFEYVVACEARDGSWCEFDAQTLLHASRLADNAVESLGARGCSVWGLDRHGALTGSSLYHVYAE
jgi:hypothetical protein